MLLPKALTLISSVVGLALVLILAWAAWRHRNPRAPIPPGTGAGETNRWLSGLRVCFALATASVLFAHCYWVFWADSNPRFAQAKSSDARNRRLADSALKGWVLDRSGRLENALIRYRADAGAITREYPLGEAAVHLTGYSDFVYGSGGLEYAYRDWLTQPVSLRNRLTSPVPVGSDLVTSIDSAFQRAAFKLLDGTGKPSAAVVLLVPGNEVLAIASTPAFDPLSVGDESKWLELSRQAEVALNPSPLVNRALGKLVTGAPAFYYRPGSTFKAFIAAVAIDTGITEEKFVCKSEGFTAPGVARPIRDFEGAVHGRIDFETAFRVSCNQYFAQLGLALGRQRLAAYARRLGFITSRAGPSPTTTGWQVREGSEDDFDRIFAPPPSRMNLSADATEYDIALQSFGQGFDDVSVLQMALLASAIANSEGAIVAPTLEIAGDPKVIGPFVNKQSAVRLRQMMKMVVESGTAAGAFSTLSHRISAGGKTGTADRDVPLYGRDGRPVVDRIDEQGRRRYKLQNWTDSWFIGFAPADNPKIAFAVMVENGGPGARSAAPLAAKLVAQAAELGYLAP